jgi:short-subunit dehydrogenase
MCWWRRSADKLAARANELAASHGIPGKVIPAHPGHPDPTAALAAELKRRRLVIDVLVNNAGVLENARFVVQVAPRRSVRLHVLSPQPANCWVVNVPRSEDHRET